MNMKAFDSVGVEQHRSYWTPTESGSNRLIVLSTDISLLRRQEEKMIDVLLLNGASPLSLHRSNTDGNLNINPE